MFKTLEEILQKTVPAARMRGAQRPVAKALLIAAAVVLALALVVAGLVVA
jgi:hypothetical protein